MGGATLATYRDADGKIGEFSRRFAVYNQKTDPEGRTVIKENTKDKRTTHWVPEVQK
jgi:formamidopyrimidine-DNA glycosylase